MRTYNIVFFHDSSDALEIPDDLKLPLQRHLNGASALVTFLKLEGLTDVHTYFLINLFLLRAAVNG
jgi:hypothetical protein